MKVLILMSYVSIFLTHKTYGQDSLIFAAFGDMGTGNASQYQVADALKKVCEEKKCSFVLGLGDNIYGTGVGSEWDPQFNSKFERPYAEIDLPFYMTLGNHDAYGNEEAQVLYSQYSDKWRMPSRYYSFTHKLGAKEIFFVALDTTYMSDQQLSWFETQKARHSDSWTIAFGHHPYRSSGYHGNAKFKWKRQFQKHFCGQIDLFLAGHDHHKEHVGQDCGVEHFVIGTGGKLRDVKRAEASKFARSSLGFGVFTVTAQGIQVEFYNEFAEQEYSTTLKP